MLHRIESARREHSGQILTGCRIVGNARQQALEEYLNHTREFRLRTARDAECVELGSLRGGEPARIDLYLLAGGYGNRTFPQQAAGGRGEAVNLAMALVRACEQHAVAPHDRRAPARQRYSRLPGDAASRRPVPRRRPCSRARDAVTAWASEAGPVRGGSLHDERHDCCILRRRGRCRAPARSIYTIAGRGAFV